MTRGIFKDLTGETFGKLKVVKRAGSDKSKFSTWECICDCGTTIIARSSCLRSGNTTSCGCSRRGPSLIGNVYGNLIVEAGTKIEGTTALAYVCRCQKHDESVVIRASHLRGGNAHGCPKCKVERLVGQKIGRLTILKRLSNETWECQCDCGKIIQVKYHVISKKAKKFTESCGCAKLEQQQKGMVNNLYRGYKRKSKSRHIEFQLTLDEFSMLIEQKCVYCGISPCQRLQSHRNKNSPYLIYNGIDRVLNEIGYEISNCVTCCWTCNRSKHGMPKDKFIEWIERAYNNLHTSH